MSAGSTEQLKFSQARDHILSWIRQGRLPAGGKLPSERELARQLSIDQRTVRRGLKDLVAAGVVINRPRVGNFVREVTPPEMVTQVAIVLPDWMLRSAPRHPIPLIIQQAVNQYMDPNEYAVSMYWYGQDRLWEDIGRNIVTRGVRGALIYPQSTKSIRDIQKITEAGVHVACLEHSDLMDEMDVFSVDTGTNTAIPSLYRKITEGLIQRGHRDVLAVNYTPSTEADAIRQELAELAELYDLGDPARMLLEVESDGYQWDTAAVERIVDRSPRPTAVLVADEFQAAQLLRACNDKRLHIPDDLSIAAVFNNTSDVHPVRLTSPNWVQLRTQASELAADHLIRSLKGERPTLLRLVLRADIQWTESVRDLSSADESERGKSKKG